MPRLRPSHDACELMVRRPRRGVRRHLQFVSGQTAVAVPIHLGPFHLLCAVSQLVVAFRHLSRPMRAGQANEPRRLANKFLHWEQTRLKSRSMSAARVIRHRMPVPRHPGTAEEARSKVGGLSTNMLRRWRCPLQGTHLPTKKPQASEKRKDGVFQFMRYGSSASHPELSY